MKKPLVVSIAAALLLAGCNSASKPDAANFQAAINQYLAHHGQVCISVDGQFPIDVPASKHNQSSRTNIQLAALAQDGLLDATSTTAVITSLANSLSLSPRKPEPVKQYAVSAEGHKFLQTIMTDSGKADGFCYGTKQVDSIVKWTEPATSRTEVTYTYKIVNLAAWAARRDVQKAFPEITAILQGASKDDQIAGLQLTNEQWTVPQP
jgi:hypothetical protein